MSFFLDVVLPLPIKETFTYEITPAEAKIIQPGMRILVPFGKRKKYTAIAWHTHQVPPKTYAPKQIDSIIDMEAVLQPIQLKFLRWIANYYLSPIGLVLRTAMPSLMLLESETEIVTHEWEQLPTIGSKNALILLEQLETNCIYSIAQIQQLVSIKNPYAILKELVAAGYVSLKEEVYAKYTRKQQTELILHPNLKGDDALKTVMDQLAVKPKQYKTLLTFLQQKAPVVMSEFSKIETVSPSSLKTLIRNEVLTKFQRVMDRLPPKLISDAPLMQLSDLQGEAKLAIETHWKTKDIVLLHGITGSGKTEVYMHLIAQQLAKGKQVLVLVPEIGLTTQLMQRLHTFFGKQLVVYHSRYSTQERTETWNKILANKEEARLVLGARSAVLLPFQNLGLVVVDESHEMSYKQFEASPRYHARDAAMVLSRMHQAKVVLGSATPTVESYAHAQSGKYGLVSMTARYKDAQMPVISYVDLSEAYRKKQMSGHLAQPLIQAMEETLFSGKQILLFQNRRGYASFVECRQCAHVPQCLSCDVSLTYHQFSKELRCHYCGYTEPYTPACKACGTLAPQSQGLGTQQLEEEVQALFPSARISRMDLDTTRKKHAHQKLINSFSRQEIDILIGTQMITKGLDFKQVTLVGVLSADNFLHFPDFRAHERAFQVLTQVAGRAGRLGDESKVLIQTFQPQHPVLSFVSNYDYASFYELQIRQREQFGYPPNMRLMRVELKHKNMSTLITASAWLKKGLVVRFSHVLGPVAPAVGRVRNYYILHLLIKLPLEASQSAAKKRLSDLLKSFGMVGAFNQVNTSIDVDPQ
jgi:primosomal protein N' (replication factor Y)